MLNLGRSRRTAMVRSRDSMRSDATSTSVKPIEIRPPPERQSLAVPPLGQPLINWRAAHHQPTGTLYVGLEPTGARTPQTSLADAGRTRCSAWSLDAERATICTPWYPPYR
jgi:hypothetical protein